MTTPSVNGAVNDLGLIPKLDGFFPSQDGCVALGGGRGVVCLITATTELTAWLIDPTGVLDATTATFPGDDTAYLATGPLIGGPGIVIGVEYTGARQIIGLTVSATTIDTAYISTPDTDAGSDGTWSYPGDGWITTDGNLGIGVLNTSISQAPVAQVTYDAATGAHIAAGAYTPNKTSTKVVYVADIRDDTVPEETFLYLDVPGAAGTQGALGDDSGALDTLEYQPVGRGVAGFGSNNNGATSVTGSGGILIGTYSFSRGTQNLIACMFATRTPPLRKIQRSDGLAMGAPRRVQTSTIQSSNRRFGII